MMGKRGPTLIEPLVVIAIIAPGRRGRSWPEGVHNEGYNLLLVDGHVKW